MKQRIALFLLVVLVALPATAYAYPFGGQIGRIINCYNQAIYAAIGAPGPAGPYIWTPSTQTYQFGPPSHSGQWLLGLSGAPYYCLVSIVPIIVEPGTSIMMMGSSQ